MPAGDSWSRLNFNRKGGLELRVAGQRFETTQFVASWAPNEIPTAQVSLAVGLDVSGTPAAIHRSLSLLTPGQTAEVWADPEGELSPGEDWPGTTRLFLGQVAGLGAHSTLGRGGVTVHLVHWLAKLGYSAATTAGGHVANPGQLNAEAVIRAQEADASSILLATLVQSKELRGLIPADLWGGVKTFLCNLANVPAIPLMQVDLCGAGSAGINAAALAALKLIEGGGADCARAYRWGTELSLKGVAPILGTVIAESIVGESLYAYANTSMWDKLVTQICPRFGLAVIPRVEDALVIANVPNYAPPQDPWRYLAGEFDTVNIGGNLERPLRGVGVLPLLANQTMAGVSAFGQHILGGCYVNPKVAAHEGAFAIIGPPQWLTNVYLRGAHVAAELLNLPAQQGSAAAGSTTPPSPPNIPEEEIFGGSIQKMYDAYAEGFYREHALRGRGGVLSGPLRFDIAPGSIVALPRQHGRFIVDDALGAARFGYVARVTVALDANNLAASTAYELTHVRTDAEGGTSRHYLFADSIHGQGRHGCPLLDDFDDFNPGI